MILTDEERDACQRAGNLNAICNAVEAAVIAKLATGVSVEPVAWFELNGDMDAWFLSYGFNPKAKTRPLYTATAIAAARVQAIKDCEDAIETANARRVLYVPDCIDAIRALLGKEST